MLPVVTDVQLLSILSLRPPKFDSSICFLCFLVMFCILLLSVVLLELLKVNWEWSWQGFSAVDESSKSQWLLRIFNTDHKTYQSLMEKTLGKSSCFGVELPEGVWGELPQLPPQRWQWGSICCGWKMIVGKNYSLAQKISLQWKENFYPSSEF